MKKGNGTIAFIIIVVVVLIIAGAIFLTSRSDKKENSNSSENQNGQIAGTTSDGEREVISTPNADILLFYGDTCPHCKKVNEFIVKNDIDKVVPLQHLEVYRNKQNQELMKQKLDQCKDLSEDDKGGVPFMYTKDKCIVGDTPIIDFLKQKANI